VPDYLTDHSKSIKAICSTCKKVKFYREIGCPVLAIIILHVAPKNNYSPLPSILTIRA
jgi:hypothetical protein